MPDASLQNDASTDSGAQRDHAHVIDMAGCTQPLFPQGGGIGIVFEDHACPEPDFDFLFHRIILPAWKVGRFTQHPALHVDDPGHANADPCQMAGAPKLCNQLLNGHAHLMDHLVASTRHLGPGGDLFQYFAVPVNCGNAEVGASEVDTDCKCRHVRFDSGLVQDDASLELQLNTSPLRMRVAHLKGG